MASFLISCGTCYKTTLFVFDSMTSRSLPFSSFIFEYLSIVRGGCNNVSQFRITPPHISNLQYHSPQFCFCHKHRNWFTKDQNRKVLQTSPQATNRETLDNLYICATFLLFFVKTFFLQNSLRSSRRKFRKKVTKFQQSVYIFLRFYIQ